MTTHPYSSLIRRIILLLSIVAMALSAWLSYQKLSGQIDSLVGCGKGSSCANILGSRWSVIFGSIPVSIASFFIYLALAFSLTKSSPLHRLLQSSLACTLIASAIWFMGIQFSQFADFCKYCVAIHSIGVLTALLTLRLASRGENGFPILSIPTGLTAVGLLALLQVFGPEPSSTRVDEVTANKTSGDIHAQGEGRSVAFLQGNKVYNVDTLPLLGNPKAQKIMIKYFDYTCDSCKSVDAIIDELLEQKSMDIAFIVLPTPLSRECNKHLPATVREHEKACLFARCALAVWRAQPEAFTSYHKWLFKNRFLSFESIREEAIERVGGQAFEAAFNDRWCQKVIQQNCDDYRVLIQRTAVMPKILLGGSRLLQGASRDLDSFKKQLSTSN